MEVPATFYDSVMMDVLRLLQEKLHFSKPVFDLWFGELKLLEFTVDHALFSTPTKLRKSVLEAKYVGFIQTALQEVVGFPVEIEFKALNEEEEDRFLPDPDKDNEFNPRDILTDAEVARRREESERKKQIIAEGLSRESGKKTLMSRYTFDNFIEGDSNKFAKAACQAVARDIGDCYNPLFIYGHSGLGKTHLLYATINYIREHHPNKKIVYRKSEDFINELIASISNCTTGLFKEKYRTADVLLIDDIQFIAGKESTQEEFFHTFSTLYEAGKQIILTSDRPPMEIRPLEERLRTRFEGGLMTDVQPPSFELRCAIIRKKADEMGLLLSEDMINYIAGRLQSNIRQIEGVLTRLIAVSSLTEATISKQRVEDIISTVDPGNVPTDVLVDKIITVVAKHYQVSKDDILSKKKTDAVASARHIAIYVIRQVTELTYVQIGEIFSRDHSTITASLNKVEMSRKTVRGVDAEITNIIKEVRSAIA